MIAILEDTQWQTVKDDLRHAQAQGYTHAIIKTPSVEIYPDMLAAVTLHNGHIVVDYTCDGWYRNDCRYFGQASITFEDWMQNNQYYPNLIFDITETRTLLAQYDVQTPFDLALCALFQHDALSTDGHVVFNFKTPAQLSSHIFTEIREAHRDTMPIDGALAFALNKLAFMHRCKLPFTTKQCTRPVHARRIDTLLARTAFKLPYFMYRLVHQHHMNKHDIHRNIYIKQPEQCHDHIVFLGFDFGYRGNSKYLYDEMVQHHPERTYYFITDDIEGEGFISPSDKRCTSLVNQAKIVIAESYIPDIFQPNGHVIQLWHGTPIKKLFLDSLEPYQNTQIYNYRARKYNQWLHQDMFIVDHPNVAPDFKSAFPMHQTTLCAAGYPRNAYLEAQQHDEVWIKTLRQTLGIDTSKPILLYAPTWKQQPIDDDTFPITDALLAQYHVLYKGHVEAHTQHIPDGVQCVAPTVETQDLILLADVVLTDYSSIIFDALCIQTPICLYTPNHQRYTAERGVYDELWQTLAPVRYASADALTADLCANKIKAIDIPYIQSHKQTYVDIATYIQSYMSGQTINTK